MGVVRAIVELEESRDFARRVYEVAMQAVDAQGKYIGIIIGCFQEGDPTLEEISLLSAANQAYGWCGNAAVILGSRADQFTKQFGECRENSRSHRRRLERESAKLYEKAETLLKAIGAAHRGLRELGEIVTKVGQRRLAALEELRMELLENQTVCGKTKRENKLLKF